MAQTRTLFAAEPTAAGRRVRRPGPVLQHGCDADPGTVRGVGCAWRFWPGDLPGDVDHRPRRAVIDGPESGTHFLLPTWSLGRWASARIGVGGVGCVRQRRGCDRGRGGVERRVVDRPGAHRCGLSAAVRGGVVVGVHHAQGVERWFNLALVVLVVVTLVISVVAFSLWQGAGMLAIVMATLAYGLAARQALGGAAPAATAQGAATPPARPWLLVNPRFGDGRPAGLASLMAPASAVSACMSSRPATTRQRGAGSCGCWRRRGRSCRRRRSLGWLRRSPSSSTVPFVCVPAGTRNHFAHDLGLDRATRWPPWVRSPARSAASMSRWWAAECS